MPSTFRIPKAKIIGLYARAMAWYSPPRLRRRPRQRLVMLHHRPVLKAPSPSSARSSKWDRARPGPEDAGRRWRAPAMIGCTWCMDFGYFTAHSKGLDIEQARGGARGGATPTVFTALERQVHGVRRGDDRDPADRHRRAGRGAAGRARGDAAFVELTMMVAVENQRSRLQQRAGADQPGLQGPLRAPRP